VAGRNPVQAVKAFAEPIQRALTCFAHGKVTTDTYSPDAQGILAFNRGEDVELNGSGISISVTMRYRIKRPPNPPLRSKPWKVSTEGWAYHIRNSSGTLAEFHWHPDLTPDVLFPHVHVASDTERRHYPTGRVLVEDVLNFAVECGATPRQPRNWKDVCSVNIENFGKGATWGHIHPPV
jgi:hypothetical protein